MKNDSIIWVSDNGDVTCFDHAGTYLRSAINNYPESIVHHTPLDVWSMYRMDLVGALPCSECVDWSTLEISA